jgi:hypothetical protein
MGLVSGTVGWVVGSIIAGAITTYLLTGMQQVAEDSVRPPPARSTASR